MLFRSAHCGREKALCHTRPIFRRFIEFLAHPHASPTHYHIPFQFPPFFLLPMPERACLEIAELFPWSVYAYTGFRTRPVKNVKHRQLPVPQISGFSRTSQANPYKMYMYGKLWTRRVHLCCHIRVWRRFWDSKAVLGSFSLFSILF